MKTEIRYCSCKHEYQDKIYGKGQRVHNYGENKYKASGGGTSGWICTVCGTVKKA